jgi:hypothetical protein
VNAKFEEVKRQSKAVLAQNPGNPFVIEAAIAIVWNEARKQVGEELDRYVGQISERDYPDAVAALLRFRSFMLTESEVKRCDARWQRK